MEIKVADLRALMDALHEKTNEPRSTQGWKNIISKIDSEDLGERYLYKSIVLKVKNEKRANAVISLRDDSAYAILKFLGHKNLEEFKESLEQKRDPQLDSCIGSYYSYLRMSEKNETVLLRSPARIYYEHGKYYFEQKGKRNVFTGEVKCMKGCVFILMISKDGKSFYHVYRIGAMTSPQVMQGIFSGVSSNFDPIGGRVVLVKSESEFSDLTIAEIPKSKIQDALLKALFGYFDTFEKNNLAVNKEMATYTIRDLS